MATLSTDQIDLARQNAFRLGSLPVEPMLCRVGSDGHVALEPRVMQVLVVLAQAAPGIVSRDMLVSRCWQGRIVGDDAINRVIGRLRKLAREVGGGSFSIETINRVGYRLIGEVATAAGASAPATSQPAPLAKLVDRPDTYKPGIAVLPFGHPPNDMEQLYFAEGVVEDIIAGLARSRLLRVTSRLSSVKYDATMLGAAEICSALGVRYLVRGQVRRLGSSLRLSIDLIDGDGDEIIWSTRYARPLGDLFDLQAEITTGIVGAIEPAVLGHEQFLAQARPHSIAFWDYFIRARHHFWKGTISDFAKAEELLVQALTLKPEDAPSLALLAMTELSNVWSGHFTDVAERVARARDYAMRAVASDPRDAGAHHALGIVLAQLGQHGQAVAEQCRSLQLNPFNAQAQGELARLLAFGGGDTDEVLVLSDAALAASPTDPHDWLWLRSKAIACFIAGRSDEAVEHAQAACARRPNYFFLHFLVAVCCAAAGDAEGARAACAQGQAIHPRYDMNGLRLGHPFVREADLQAFAKALKSTGWAG